MDRKKLGIQVFHIFLLRRFLCRFFFNPLYSPEFQIKFLYQRFQLLVILWITELGGFEEGDAVLLDWFARRLRFPSEEPVGNVDVILQIFSISS